MTVFHKNVFKRCGEKTSNSDAAALIIHTPKENDVLCGKDKTYNKHPGNQKFRERIEASVEKYQQVKTKQDKMRFTRDFVHSMRTDYNTRFLKRITLDNNIAACGDSDDKYAWQEISQQMARDKVSHALRFAAKSKRKSSSVVSDSTLSDESNNSSSSNKRARKTNEMDDCVSDQLAKICLTLEQPTKSAAAEGEPAKKESPTFRSCVDAIFHRQQAILGKLHVNNNKQADNDNLDAMSEEDDNHYNTLRSEDFADMIQQPLAGIRTLEEASQFNEEGFSSIRSQDLNLLLKEPFDIIDWASGGANVL